MIVPAAAAARAVASSPPGCAIRCIASGAIRTGSATSVPSTVDEDPRAEPPALERGDIVAERDLVARPAEEVRGRVRVELLLREVLVVPDVDRLHAPIKDETR